MTPEIGSKVTLNGYSYYVTLHGPMIMGTCADCGADALKVGHTDRVNQWGLRENAGVPVVRCTSCWRRFHGLGMA